VTRSTEPRRRAYRPRASDARPSVTVQPSRPTTAPPDPAPSGWRRWRSAVARAFVDDDVRPLLRLAERAPP
jgi:hypothetical protein